ncbi:MAG TPA: aldo/keto reductase [Terriglobales bacterium]|nr:aldo/keto reductase [Terriglobales bacterium]
MISGFATAEGCARFAQHFPQAHLNFRRPEWVQGVGELTLSSMGIGTYLGEPDDDADRAYTAALAEALASGINVVDSAINYRHQRSERNIGAAMSQLIGEGKLRRDEVLVCTKAGYLTFDGDMPSDPRAYFMKEYIEPGILDPAEIAGGMHCMAPRFLADQLERSRRNLGLETIDVFYVHNPETQLASVPPTQFVQRLAAAFRELEQAADAGKIRWYGVASWNAFRVAPGDNGYMPLEAVLRCAYEAGGEGNHCRFIQLPFNLAMTEAWSSNNHQFNEETISALEFVHRVGIAAIGSGTLAQGQLAGDLPEVVSKRLGMRTSAENAIQFARSAPGLVTALVGMGRPEHVKANVKITAHPPADLDQWRSLFPKSRQESA